MYSGFLGLGQILGFTDLEIVGIWESVQLEDLGLDCDLRIWRSLGFMENLGFDGLGFEPLGLGDLRRIGT